MVGVGGGFSHIDWVGVVVGGVKTTFYSSLVNNVTRRTTHKESVDHFGYFRGLNMSLFGIFRLLKKIKDPFWSFQAPNDALPWLNQVSECQPFWRFQALYINQPYLNYKAPELNN